MDSILKPPDRGSRMTASVSDPSTTPVTFCQDNHFGTVIGSVTSAPVCHAGVNVTVLALRLVGKVEFTLADKGVVFPISQFHYSSVMHSVDVSSKSVLAATSVRASLQTVRNSCKCTLKRSVCNQDGAHPRDFRASSVLRSGGGALLSIRHDWVIPLGEDGRQSRRRNMSTFVCVVGAGRPVKAEEAKA